MFREGIDYRVDASGCWLWLRSTNPKGYPLLGGGWWRSSGGRSILAHRISWEVASGTRIEAGHTVDHRCRVRSCINPSHLKPGPHSANVRAGSRTKLTADDVREIRALQLRRTPTRLIADRFGVSMVQVRKIATGHAWADVT